MNKDRPLPNNMITCVIYRFLCSSDFVLESHVVESAQWEAFCTEIEEIFFFFFFFFFL